LFINTFTGVWMLTKHPLECWIITTRSPEFPEVARPSSIRPEFHQQIITVHLPTFFTITSTIVPLALAETVVSIFMA
jgi:hypothetical protein